MTPRDLVRKTLEFDSPARIPRQLWLLPWATERYPDEVAAIQRRFPDDIVTTPGFFTRPLPVCGDRHMSNVYVDEWGCKFEALEVGVIGEVKSPPLADWSRLDAVRIPTERLSVGIEEVNEFCRATDRFVLTPCLARPFERLQFLRGTEKLLVDLIRQPRELATLIARIHEFYLEELEIWARTDVDALMIMDDWGTQHAMLISPKLWRGLLKPLYAEYVEVAHRCGKYIFVHSDGHILDVFPDVVELGFDAINCQIACMGIEAVAEQAAGKLTFWGEIDRQQLLPHGTPEQVRDTVRRMHAALYRNGGVIAQCEFGPGANPENVMAVFEAWGALTGV